MTAATSVPPAFVRFPSSRPWPGGGFYLWAGCTVSHDDIRTVPTTRNDTVLSKRRGRGATDRANSSRLLGLLSRVSFNRSVESQLNGEIEIAMVRWNLALEDVCASQWRSRK